LSGKSLQWAKDDEQAPSAGRKLPIANCQLTLQGTGKPRREFLYVDDLADAVVFLMNNYNAKDIGEFINIGFGKIQLLFLLFLRI